jgi:hypothetical protein
VHPITWILTRKTWNPSNSNRHQIWGKRCRLEPLNQPRSKRRPRGGRWAASWSQKSARAIVHHRPCSDEGSRHREPSWSRSPPRFTPGKDLVDPHIILPQKPYITMPQRALERSSDEPPMAPPHWACAPPPSVGLDVSHPFVDGGPGLDHRYRFILIKS